MQLYLRIDVNRHLLWMKGKKKKKRGDYKEEEEVSNQYKVKAEDDEREPDHNKSLVRVVVC